MTTPASEDRPSIAVGVCTYNRGRRIEPTLERIAGLDPAGGRLREVVIVDNNSGDDTAAVIDAFIARGTRVPMRRVHEPIQGKPEAVRRLFSETQDPIVAMIDDDCLPEPEWASAVLGVFDDDPRAGAVGGPVENVWESGPTRLARIYHRSLGDQLLGPERIRLDAPGAFLMGGAMAMRRRAVVETGWLESRRMDCRRGARLEAGDDAELCIRIHKLGYTLWYEPRARMGHLIPAGRQTRAYLARLRESICRSEPWLAWMVEPTPTATWAAQRERRARMLWIKSLLFDARPTRRAIRVAERLGRYRGWRQVRELLESAGDRSAP